MIASSIGRSPDTRWGTADEFVGFLAAVMPQSIQTRHHVHNFQVEFTSRTEAVVRWDHENWTWFEDGSRPNIQQWGQYREKYRQTASGWLIAYFSEQYLFNSRAPAKRRRAGSVMATWIEQRLVHAGDGASGRLPRSACRTGLRAQRAAHDVGPLKWVRPQILRAPLFRQVEDLETLDQLIGANAERHADPARDQIALAQSGRIDPVRDAWIVGTDHDLETSISGQDGLRGIEVLRLVPPAVRHERPRIGHMDAELFGSQSVHAQQDRLAGLQSVVKIREKPPAAIARHRTGHYLIPNGPTHRSNAPTQKRTKSTRSAAARSASSSSASGTGGP